MKFDTHELAWAAGFFDGEGTTLAHRLRGGGNSPRVWTYPQLQIAQVDPRPLFRFKRAVHMGAIRGPYHRTNRNHSSFFNWRSRGWREALAITALLWNWLSGPKREQSIKTFMLFKAEAALLGHDGIRMARLLESPQMRLKVDEADLS